MADESNLKANQSSADDLQAKLEEARRALEGEEHAQKREQEEKQHALKDEKGEIERRLSDIAQQKEILELAWVDLDTKRKAIHTLLTPILEEEKQSEAEETKLETEEASIGVESEKHGVEERRWEVQEKRRDIEQHKWTEEQKLIQIEKSIGENTTKYRALLDEEDKLTARLEQLKAEEV